MAQRHGARDNLLFGMPRIIYVPQTIKSGPGGTLPT